MKKHIFAALLSLAALAAAAQADAADTRPFKFCTDFEQVRYGNEFIIAHPLTITDGSTTMYVLSQTYDKPERAPYERNIAYSYVCNGDTLMVPFITEAEILTLREIPKQNIYKYSFILNRTDSDGNELFLIVNEEAINNTQVSLMASTKSVRGFKITINPETHLIDCNAYADGISNPYNKLVFTKNRAVYSFLCDKLEGSNKSQPNYEPYFYFRPRLDLEYFTCDLPGVDDIWSLTEYDETVFYTFDNPYYVDNLDDITWNVALTDAVLGEQIFEGSGTSMELSIALPGTYDITVNDGIADYHRTLTVNPDPDRHFTTINYLNKPHFSGGYKIPNYTEGYNYYYKYDSLISDSPEETESHKAKATALDGFTAYDHSTGIPEPSTSYGILTLAVERNGVSATHEILYSEVSGLDSPTANDAAQEHYFDLTGRSLPEAPAKGIFIRVSGPKVEKASAAN